MAVPWVYLKGGKMLGDEGKQLPLLESNFYHASGIRLVYCQRLVAVPWVYLKGGKMLGDERKQLPLLESNFYHASGIGIQAKIMMEALSLRGL